MKKLQSYVQLNSQIYREDQKTAQNFHSNYVA